MVLQLFAPGKSHVFFRRRPHGVEIQEDYLMNVTPEGDRFWIELSGINPTQEYRYQYHVMPNDDRFPTPMPRSNWIIGTTLGFRIDLSFPGRFPVGSTNQAPVSVFQTGGTDFEWTDGDLTRPAQENLVIYELLVRDFSEERTFDFIIDTLDYWRLEHHGLGVDARQ